MGVGFGHLIRDWRTSNRPFALAAINRRVYFQVEQTMLGLRRAALFLAHLFTSYRRASCLFVSGMPRYHSLTQLVAFHSQRFAPLAQGYALGWVNGFLTNMGALFRTFWGHTMSSTMRFKQRSRRTWFLESVRGLDALRRFPDVICFLSVAGVYGVGLREALMLRIPVVAFVDSDVEVSGIAYPISSNDDSSVGTHMKILFFRELLLRAFKQTLYSELGNLHVVRQQLSSATFRGGVEDYVQEITTFPDSSSSTTSSVLSVNSFISNLNYSRRRSLGWRDWLGFFVFTHKRFQVQLIPVQPSRYSCKAQKQRGGMAGWEIDKCPSWLLWSLSFTVMGWRGLLGSMWFNRVRAVNIVGLLWGWCQGGWRGEQLCLPFQCLELILLNRSFGLVQPRWQRRRWLVGARLLLQEMPRFGLLWWGRFALSLFSFKLYTSSSYLTVLWWFNRLGPMWYMFLSMWLDWVRLPKRDFNVLLGSKSWTDSRHSVICNSDSSIFYAPSPFRSTGLAPSLSRSRFKLLVGPAGAVVRRQLMVSRLYRHKLQALACRMLRRRALVEARSQRVRFNHLRTQYQLRINPGLLTFLLRRLRSGRRRYSTLAARFIPLFPVSVRWTVALRKKHFRIHPYLYHRYFHRLWIRRFVSTVFPVTVTSNLPGRRRQLKDPVLYGSIFQPLFHQLWRFLGRSRLLFYSYTQSLLRYRLFVQWIYHFRSVTSFNSSFLTSVQLRLILYLRKLGSRLYNMYQQFLVYITQGALRCLSRLMCLGIFSLGYLSRAPSLWLGWLHSALCAYRFTLGRPSYYLSFNNVPLLRLCRYAWRKSSCFLNDLGQKKGRQRFSLRQVYKFTAWFSEIGRILPLWLTRFRTLLRNSVWSGLSSSLQRIGSSFVSALPVLFYYRAFSQRHWGIRSHPQLSLFSFNQSASSFRSVLYAYRHWRRARTSLLLRILRSRGKFSLLSVQRGTLMLRVFA